MVKDIDEIRHSQLKRVGELTQIHFRSLTEEMYDLKVNHSSFIRRQDGWRGPDLHPSFQPKKVKVKASVAENLNDEDQPVPQVKISPYISAHAKEIRILNQLMSNDPKKAAESVKKDIGSSLAEFLKPKLKPEYKKPVLAAKMLALQPPKPFGALAQMDNMITRSRLSKYGLDNLRQGVLNMVSDEEFKAVPLERQSVTALCHLSDRDRRLMKANEQFKKAMKINPSHVERRY